MNEIKLTGGVIPVVLNVVKREDGSQYVLPRLETLKSNLSSAERNLRVSESECEAVLNNDRSTGDSRGAAEHRRWLSRQQVESCTDAITRYEAALLESSPVTYRVNIPTYDELLKLEEDCVVEKSGMKSLDTGKMRKIVIPLMLAEAQVVPVTHGPKLWERWLSEVYPGEDIPF